MVRLARVDLRQAERLARAAAWLSRQIGRRGVARRSACAPWAISTTSSGRHEAAWKHYQQALEIYQRLGNELEAGRTLSGPCRR